VVLGCSVVLSLAAQVVEAEPSPIGWTAAAIPALVSWSWSRSLSATPADRPPRHSTIPQSAQSPPTHPRSTAQLTWISGPHRYGAGPADRPQRWKTCGPCCPPPRRSETTWPTAATP
jgi:hypothetical protein